MTDIVERLRDYIALKPNSLMREAAAQLEENTRLMDAAKAKIESLQREIGLRQQPPPGRTNIVERLRADGLHEAADEIEQLRREVKTAHHQLHRPYPGSLSEENDALIAECHELHEEHTEMLKILNLCRIMLKNRDQRPEEMQLLDAIKMVVAKAEGR